ncbi:MAG: hypothetical protein ACRD8Z_11955 [Nitrososphaeraceae archaeon]
MTIAKDKEGFSIETPFERMGGNRLVSVIYGNILSIQILITVAAKAGCLFMEPA